MFYVFMFGFITIPNTGHLSIAHVLPPLIYKPCVPLQFLFFLFISLPYWLKSRVVSVLFSVTTEMTPLVSLLIVTLIFVDQSLVLWACLLTLLTNVSLLFLHYRLLTHIISLILSDWFTRCRMN